MRLKRGITPLRLLLLSVLGSVILFQFSPDQQSNPTPQQLLSVEAQQVQSQPFQIKIKSFGQIKPRVRSKLVAQAGGLITTVSENFRTGGSITKGEILIGLDDRDYQFSVTRAEANYAEAMSQLVLENALSEQARIDWQRLGKGIDSAPDLVLRKPQLASAMAQVDSARANLNQARLDLLRTIIVAPYTGRVLNQFVDLGEAVKANDPLAEIYATDYVEVRLPIRNSDLPFAILPESLADLGQSVPVILRSTLLGNQEWLGRLVRTEGAVDEKNRQLYVVARIDNPYGFGSAGRASQLKIGQYVTAEIDGRKIEKAIIIPNNTIYQGSYVYVLEDSKIFRRQVTILWQDNRQALIGEGIEAGELLVVSTIGRVISGTAVKVISRSSEQGSHATGSKALPAFPALR